MWESADIGIVIVYREKPLKEGDCLYLLFWQLERFHVVTDDLQLLLQLNDFTANNTIKSIISYFRLQMLTVEFYSYCLPVCVDYIAKFCSILITGQPTHSAGGQYCFAVWCLSSSVVCRRLYSVTLHGGRAGGFTRAGQVMTSCPFQSNYSSTITLHRGPVVLRSVRATPCFISYNLGVICNAMQ